MMKLKKILCERYFSGKPIEYIVDGVFYKYTHTDMSTGGTCDARYCYSVWMRHLSYYYEIKHNVPEIIAEFGPGDTIGIGLTAILCGVKNYYALDFAQYSGMKEIKIVKRKNTNSR